MTWPSPASRPPLPLGLLSLCSCSWAHRGTAACGIMLSLPSAFACVVATLRNGPHLCVHESKQLHPPPSLSCLAFPHGRDVCFIGLGKQSPSFWKHPSWMGKAAVDPHLQLLDLVRWEPSTPVAAGEGRVERAKEALLGGVYSFE